MSHSRKGEACSGGELGSAFILGTGDQGPREPARRHYPKGLTSRLR